VHPLKNAEQNFRTSFSSLMTGDPATIFPEDALMISLPAT
jgi:hypothetical protein